MTKIVCGACSLSPNSERQWCRECEGRGYFERLDRLPGCTREPSVCPLEGEAMTGGWMCAHCGDSGPL